MKKTDWTTYIKLFLGLSLTFPVQWAFWNLEFGLLEGFKITLIIHFSLVSVGILMINFLETGSCFKRINK